MNDYVVIGKIINTHGIKGELKVDSYTDFVDERFKKGTDIYIGEEHLPFKVNSCRTHKGFLLVQLKDNEDINLVEKYRNMLIYKAKKDIKPLPEGEYYFSDLKDLEVWSEDECLGKVLQVEEGSTHNNLRVKKNADNKEYLIPFIPVFINKVDLEEKRIYINMIEGLL